METSRLIDNLENYNNISSNKELDLIFEELTEFPFDDFIYIEYVGNSKNLKIMELFDRLVNKVDSCLKANSIEINVAMIKSLILIFKKGVSEINLIYFAIFLHANSRVDLPIGILVEKYDLKDEFVEILKKLTDILRNIQIQVVDQALSMYFDKLNDINKEKTLIPSLRDVAFEKYSSLIKNNKCYFPNHFYQMVVVLQKYNQELFEEVLNSDNVFTLVLLIKCMSFDEIKSFFIKYTDIGEKTLVCFLMKFLRVDFENKQNYSDVIVDMCIELYSLNKALFKELMCVFMYNEFFNEILGLMFCDLPNDDVRYIIDEFRLSDNVRMINMRTKMLKKCEESENFDYIVELIYKKWETHLLNALNENKKAFKILCTDFCNFIVSYYIDKCDNEELLNSMKKLFIKLKNLDGEWSVNIIHHKNKFFVYYSKLFIFSVIYKFNKLDDDEIKMFYNDFYEEYVLFKKFLDNDKENFLDKFEENLLCNS